jgi:hypothetical protein
MEIAVIAGVRITKYFTPVFSAISPKNGFNRAGTFLATSKIALIKSEIPSFSMRRGNSGAKKAEYVSCARCANESVKTLSF